MQLLCGGFCSYTACVLLLWRSASPFSLIHFPSSRTHLPSSPGSTRPTIHQLCPPPPSPHPALKHIGTTPPPPPPAATPIWLSQQHAFFLYILPSRHPFSLPFVHVRGNEIQTTHVGTWAMHKKTRTFLFLVFSVVIFMCLFIYYDVALSLSCSCAAFFFSPFVFFPLSSSSSCVPIFCVSPDIILCEGAYRLRQKNKNVCADQRAEPGFFLIFDFFYSFFASFFHFCFLLSSSFPFPTHPPCRWLWAFHTTPVRLTKKLPRWFFVCSHQPLANTPRKKKKEEEEPFTSFYWKSVPKHIILHVSFFTPYFFSLPLFPPLRVHIFID